MKTMKLGNLAGTRSLLINLTLRENRGRYKRSALGWAWSMVNPLSTMLIFTFVFRVVLRIEPPVGEPSGLKNFPFFLLAALLPWNFLSNGLSAANGSIIANAGLIKKVYFTRAVLPAAAVLSWNTNLLIELGVLTLALAVAGNFVFLLLPLVLVVVLLQTFFVLGVGVALAALNVYFRDIEHFLSILLLLWFYATPVIYPISLVPQFHEIAGFTIPIRTVYDMNPMVHFVQAYRSLFYDGAVPPAQSFLVMAAYSFVAMLVGMWVFRKLEARFAEEL
ncbi:MAG: ABC transporter permease [Actinomycetota bacterium]|nr:ABC transporter permease [Actinomycetota bacterium]